MAIEVRNADKKDKTQCIELLAALSSAINSVTAQSLGDSFKELLSQARGEILLATEQDVVLGMATVSYNVALRYGGEYCQLEELIVRPEARGKKVGGLLLQTAILRARARGCAEMGLYLLASTEHNRPFYEKYGFEGIGTELRQRLN